MGTNGGSSKDNPLVSVIIATYNRSNILGYVISSVVNSSYTNWELIVVGDACTDDTGEVVASFDDSRITYINLKHNFGEQSGPNNCGLRRAGGEFIAFLNHDDLWLHDHLEILVESMIRNDADLVYSPGFSIRPDGTYYLTGATKTFRYDPTVKVPASLWLFRKSMLMDVGYWRFSHEIYNTPSQDWLFRAWRKRYRMISTQNPSALLLKSATRKNAYKERSFAEHEKYFAKIKNKIHGNELSTIIGVRGSRSRGWKDIFSKSKKFVKKIVFRACVILGVSPFAFVNFIVFRRKGGIIRHLRKIRGLENNRKGPQNERR